MNEFDAKAFWEKKLREHWGFHGVGFAGLGENYNAWLYKVRAHAFRRLIKFVDRSFWDANVVDIGSGTGFYIEHWKRAGVKTVVGTDITEISITRLRERFPGERFYQVDIGAPLTLLLPGIGEYDIVSAFDVLFHIVDDTRYETAMANVFALLRRGGWFIFSDNFLHHETERGRDQVCYSLEHIQGVLDSIGFQVIKRLPMFVLMNYPVDSCRSAPKLLWRRLLMRPVQNSELVGQLYGGMLYPLELLLTALLSESPTTEIMVCRKAI